MKYEKLYNLLVQQQQEKGKNDFDYDIDYDYEIDEEEKTIVNIQVSAKTYFELDADRLEESQKTDYVLVNIDFKNETTEYVWVSEGENPSNYPYEGDDFDGVCELLEELYMPKLEQNIIQILEKEIITNEELVQLQEHEYLTYEYNTNNYLHQDCYYYTFTFIDGQEWDCYTPKEQEETQQENDVQNTKQGQKYTANKTVFDYWDGYEWVTVPIEIIKTWFDFKIDYNSIVSIKECAGVDKLEINTIDDTIYCKKNMTGKYSEPTVIR